MNSHITGFLLSLSRLLWGSRWKRLLTCFVLTILLLTGLTAITLEVTSSPGFCKSCHNMKPFYDSWAKSSHNHVDCKDCHIPPNIEKSLKGRFASLSMVSAYFTGADKRKMSWAEISDESCLRSGCHDTRTLAGVVQFKKDIRFDHTPHLGGLRNGKQLRCTSCHSQIVQGSHISVTEDACFLCHFKNNDGIAALSRCTLCHQPPVNTGKTHAPVSAYDHKLIIDRGVHCRKCHGNMVVGDGAVPEMLCSTCHSIESKMLSFADGGKMHRIHIAEHKIECHQCHIRIQHKSVSRTPGIKPGCKSCHPNFHNVQFDLFSGKGGRGVPDHPSPMYVNGLNCQACHLFHQDADNFKPKGENVTAGSQSCEPCHGSGYNNMLNNWKSQTRQSMKRLEKILDNVGSIVEKNWKQPGYEAAENKLKDARYNYNLVKHGNSIHNIAFANRLMEKSYQMAYESLKQVAAGVKLPRFQTEKAINPGDCNNCHPGLKLKDISVFGWRYNHDKHLNIGLACNRCHSNRQKHGQLIMAKQDCMTCHHRGDQSLNDESCRGCHHTQDKIYFSTLRFSTYNISNVMSRSVTCNGCHRDDEQRLHKPGNIICSNCHQTEYEEKFLVWRQAGIELLNRLRAKVQNQNQSKGDLGYDTLKLLEKDGSKGIHNPQLYKRLVLEALK